MTNTESIHRTLIWSGWLRLSHWALALSSLVLIITGWLLPVAPSILNFTSDWHYLAAVVFTTALVLRLWLLFTDKKTGGLAALTPGGEVLPAIGQMLRFYITLGKAPLPSWYAHNPLWAPVYLVAIFIMILLTVTGMVMDDHPGLFNIYLPDFHVLLAKVFTAFVVLHIIAVFMHDLKGTGSDISAMVNGHRIFVVEKTDEPVAAVQQISLDDIGK